MHPQLNQCRMVPFENLKLNSKCIRQKVSHLRSASWWYPHVEFFRPHSYVLVSLSLDTMVTRYTVVFKVR
jgi:hypothetical protein